MRWIINLLISQIQIYCDMIPSKVKMLNPNVFIGMDVLKRRPVITDKNPHVEGLQDVHKCIYLPSSMDKNQYLPNYLNQNILFMVTQPVHWYIFFRLSIYSRSSPVPHYLHLVQLQGCFLPLQNQLAAIFLLHMTQPYTNIGFSGNIKQSLFLSDIYQTGYVLRISSKNPYLPPDLGKAEMQFTMIFVLKKTFLHVLESCHLLVFPISHRKTERGGS